jgi:O-antigen ligase
MLGRVLRDALRRLPLERAVQLSIIATVVGAALASSSIASWASAGRQLRVAALAALALAAIAYVAAIGPRRPGLAHWLAGALAGLAVLSAAWSVNPTESLADGLAFAAIVGAAVLISLAAHEPGAVRSVVLAVLAAMTVIALAGVALLAVDPAQAIGEATRVDPARYSGIGGNPNTVPLLLALGVPLAAALALREQDRRVQVASAAAAVLFVGSIVASGSRGALVGAFAGLALVAVLVTRDARRRTLAVLGVVSALAAGAAIAELPDPDPTGTVGYVPPSQPARTGGGYYNAGVWLPLEDEVGRPPFGEAAADERPGVLGSSGRLDAWESATRSGLERPAAGFGFGQEDKGFTDRLASFEADLPENSFLGLFLQLGFVGLALFVALVATLVTAWRSGARRDPRLAAGCAGAVLAGLVLAVVQSYVYAPGAIASAALWLCAFALVGLAEPAA